MRLSARSSVILFGADVLGPKASFSLSSSLDVDVDAARVTRRASSERGGIVVIVRRPRRGARCVVNTRDAKADEQSIISVAVRCEDRRLCG